MGTMANSFYWGDAGFISSARRQSLPGSLVEECTVSHTVDGITPALPIVRNMQ